MKRIDEWILWGPISFEKRGGFNLDMMEKGMATEFLSKNYRKELMLHKNNSILARSQLNYPKRRNLFRKYIKNTLKNKLAPHIPFNYDLKLGLWTFLAKENKRFLLVSFNFVYLFIQKE